MTPESDSAYVKYSDALVALRISGQHGYEQGQRDALAAAESLLHDDPCDCDDCRQLVQVIAAIKGETS